MNIPRATYRVQLHRGFTFRDAQAIVPYLAALGVSHLYASPFLKARPGSLHGYDVVDHAALNPEIGTQDDLDALCDALRAHGMGLMVDLVPNHMGVQKADNGWWLDVLEHGRASPYAGYFDIDWEPESPELAGKVLVPILGDQYGSVLERGELTLRFDAGAGELSLWYHEHRLPIRPAEYPRVLLASADRVDGTDGAAQTLRALSRDFEATARAGGGDPAVATAALKARLATLCGGAPEVARRIEANVRALNGVAGEPASFDALHALIKGQVYRLAFWRVAADDINYRRFFDVNELAALRAEREDVFAATHRLPLALLARGQADCLRIDHPDGLLDPGAYFERLQRAAAQALGGAPRDARGRAVYVAIEKILADHERMAPAWPVHGTTGYRFMNVVNGLFVDPAARAKFDHLYAAFIGERLDFDEVLRRSKTMIVVHALASELNRLAAALTRIAKRDRHTCDYTRNSLRRALVEVVACFPVYRTYATAAGMREEDRRYVDWAVAVARRQSAAADPSVFDFIGVVLRGDVRPPSPADRAELLGFVQRFQQLTAPVTAKGMEDTSFYVYTRLASLNEVGGDPRTFGFTVQAFHGASQDRAATWPHTMLATSTHDNKRSEDVRTRIDVLSEMPAAWRLSLRRWRQLNRRHRTVVDGASAPSPNDEYLLYQTLLGAWPLGPLDESALSALRERIQAYMQKAVREAKVRTSWVNPDPAYEAALARFVDGLLGAGEGNRFLPDFTAVQRVIARNGCVNSLAQTAVKLTSPGVPDTYQGTELWDFSLVDPDNRRPVDYARRAALLQELAARDAADPRALAGELLDAWQDGRVKLWLTWRLLRLRHARAAWFERAGYAPIGVQGEHAKKVCAYARTGEGAALAVVVPRLWLDLVPDPSRWPLGPDTWGDTRLVLPPALRAWRNVLTGEAHDDAGASAVGNMLAGFPVAVLEPQA